MKSQRVGRDVKEFSKFRPKVISDYITVRVIKTDGEFYNIKNPRQLRYLVLDSDEFYIFEKMNGRENFESLVTLYFEKTRQLATTRIKNLIIKLAEKGFLENANQLWQIISKPAHKKSTEDLFASLLKGIKLFQSGYYRAEGFFEGFYNSIGKYFFSPYAIFLVLILATTGIILFFHQISSTPHYLFQINDSYGAGFTYTYFLIIATIILEALTRGSSLKAINRGVLNFKLYFPYGLFTTDILDDDSLMASRKEKIFYFFSYITSLIVPIAFVAPFLILYEGEWNTYTQVSLITVFVSLFLLYLAINPFIESPGIKLTEEIFNLSTLRKRTATFFRKRFFMGKLTFSKDFYREELIYTLTGLYGLLWLAGLIYISWKLFNILFYYDALERIYYLNPTFGNIFIFEATEYKIFTVLLLLTPVILGIIFAIYLAYLFIKFIVEFAEEIVRVLTSGKGSISPFSSEIFSELKEVPLFVALGEEELKEVAKHLKVEKFPNGRNIVTQGEKGDKFYTIKSGWANVIYEGISGMEDIVAELGPGDCFGEIALIENVKRTATVRAKTDTELISLDKETFKKHFVETFGTGEKITFIIRTSQFLKRLPLFADFSSKELFEIISKMQSMEVGPGTIIIKQGEIGDKFYLLQEGEVEVILEQITEEGYKEIKLAELGSGSYFGEIALLKNVPRTATVKAKTACKLLWLDKENFLEIFRKHLGAISEILKVTERRLEEQKKFKEEEKI